MDWLEIHITLILPCICGAGKLYVKAIHALRSLVLAVPLCLISIAAPVAKETSHEIRDLHYGEVLFHFYQENYFTAITKLMAARHLGRTPNHEIDSELLLGGMDLSYGLHQEAGRIFRRLLDENARQEVRNRAWYYLGKISYQRGYLDRAEHYLRRMTDIVQKETKGEQQLLLAQILLAKRRYRQAIDILQAWEGTEHWKPYAQFNLGIALIHFDQRNQGLRVLDRVGNLDPKNREQEALRDKANLVLGYTLIEDGKPAEARAHFERVSLHGPYSNRALLGTGWADTELHKHHQALVPWSELQGRELIDVSVQESMLAVPYAYSRLNAHGRAVSLYQQAIQSYGNEIAQLYDSITGIREGRLVSALLEHNSGHGMGWFWTLEELPDLPETRYLTHLLAKHDFQEAMKNFRDLRFLKQNLLYWQKNVDAFEDMLDDRRRHYGTHLPAAKKILSELNITELVVSRDALSEHLNHLIGNEDVLGLATLKQRRHWKTLEHLQQRLDAIAQLREAQQLEHKHRLLKGMLIWELNDQYAARLWKNRKRLKQLDASIEKLRVRRDSLQQAVLSAPARFEGFEARIKEIHARIESLLPKVSAGLTALGEHLANLAVVELEQRRQQLESYLTQARYSLAQSYDHASSRSGR